MRYSSPFCKWSVLALTILIPGCIWGSVQYDLTLEKGVIKNIESGKTTRMNILEWFGPPAILARKVGVVPLPSLDKNNDEMRKINSRVFFKYFLERHTISEHHVVYYYLNEWEKINGFSIPIGNTLLSLPLSSTDLQFTELWVLVNRTTGLVEDYVFLEAEEK
jgi:hypothetical protein